MDKIYDNETVRRMQEQARYDMTHLHGESGMDIIDTIKNTPQAKENAGKDQGGNDKQGNDVMITVNTDQDTIDKASEVFKNMDLTVNEAINIFLNECILYGDFPFVVQTCDLE